MLKRIVSIAILTVLLFHIAGIYLFTVVRLGEIRMEQRRRLSTLPDDRLEVLRIPADSFRESWLDELELEWQGKMFDIARITRSRSEVIVYGVHDEDEDNLLSVLSTIVDNASGDTKPAPVTVVKFLQLKFIAPLQLTFAPLPAQDALPVESSSAFRGVIPDPAFPPPRG